MFVCFCLFCCHQQQKQHYGRLKVHGGHGRLERERHHEQRFRRRRRQFLVSFCFLFLFFVGGGGGGVAYTSTKVTHTSRALCVVQNTRRWFCFFRDAFLQRGGGGWVTGCCDGREAVGRSIRQIVFHEIPPSVPELTCLAFTDGRAVPQLGLSCEPCANRDCWEPLSIVCRSRVHGASFVAHATTTSKPYA